jgi:hypothetical protein
MEHIRKTNPIKVPEGGVAMPLPSDRKINPATIPLCQAEAPGAGYAQRALCSQRRHPPCELTGDPQADAALVQVGDHPEFSAQGSGA